MIMQQDLTVLKLTPQTQKKSRKEQISQISKLKSNNNDNKFDYLSKPLNKAKGNSHPPALLSRNRNATLSKKKHILRLSIKHNAHVQF